jgi:Mg-chelatase subunit ChlD
MVGLLTLLLIVAAVPLTLYLGQQQQDVRQHAAEQVCTSDQATDTMMIFDQSGSMTKVTSDTDSTSRMKRAKEASSAFLDILAKRTQTPLHEVSVTTISSEESVKVVQSLTQNLTNVKTAINNLSALGSTCIECAIRKAEADFAAKERGGVKNVAVMLTDGGAQQYIGGPASGSTANKTLSDQKALAAAIDVHNKFGMAFYTIGFGDSINDKLLIDIATKTGGKFYFAPDGATLTAIYKQIAEEIGKGTISGAVYNDDNRNKIQDASETGLSGWKVTLTNSTTNTVSATTTTDAQGTYAFTGICDGNYKASVTLQTNWDITTPTNPDYISLAVSKGGTVPNKNFGVTQHPITTSLVCSPTSVTLNSTPQALSVTLKDSSGNPLSGKSISWSGNTLSQLSATTSTTNSNGVASVVISVPASSPEDFSDTIRASFAGDIGNSQSSCQISADYTPQNTTLSLNVLLHGLGNAGDNANLTSSTLSNKSPLHTSHEATISITDTNNTLVKQVDSTITYDPTSGSFKGSFDLGTTFPAGKYSFKVASEHYLHRLIPGLITVSANKNNVLPTVSLISGDTNSDNKLDILDYNMIVDCYSDYLAPVACDSSKKTAADLTDDGNVNQFDNNLFDRELSVQFGD